MRRGPTRVGDLLGAVLAQVAKTTGSGPALGPVWTQAVGALVASHASPIALDGGRLRIRCDSPAWKTELERREEELVARLRPALGARTVVRLSFELA